MKNKKYLLNQFRRNLIEINNDIISLIAKRNNICLEIHKIKKELKLPLTDKTREQKVIKKAKKIAINYKINPKLIEEIIQLIIKESKRRLNNE